MTVSEPSYLQGIDVSHFQGTVDWPAVAKGGVRFAFIKATDGIDGVDPRFAENWGGAKDAGIVRGAYHFFRPALNAQQQAEHFGRVVPIDDLALPPALDIEVTDGLAPSALQVGIRTWLATVQAAFGCTPILYTDPTFWRENVAADFSSYPLWLACYAEKPEVPSTWPALTFWQHTDRGDVSGISGHVDLNYCTLPYDELQKLRAR